MCSREKKDKTKQKERNEKGNKKKSKSTSRYNRWGQLLTNARRNHSKGELAISSKDFLERRSHFSPRDVYFQLMKNELRWPPAIGRLEGQNMVELCGLRFRSNKCRVGWKENGILVIFFLRLPLLFFSTIPQFCYPLGPSGKSIDFVRTSERTQ